MLKDRAMCLKKYSISKSRLNSIIFNRKLSYPKDKKEDENIKELLSLLLNKNPNERCISLKQIKSCILFKDFNWEMLVRKKLNPPFIPQVVKCSQEKMIQNTSMLFLTFLSNEKPNNMDNDSSYSVKLNKDLVITSQNEERSYKPTWFNDF